MNITEFTEPEKLALLDLLVLGMYADGHLALSEETRIQRLLETMSFSSDHARQECLDAVVHRVRELADSAGAVAVFVRTVSQAFATADSRRRACDALDDLFTADGRVTEHEREFLAAVRQGMQC